MIWKDHHSDMPKFTDDAKITQDRKKKNEDGNEEIFHLQSGLNVKW